MTTAVLPWVWSDRRLPTDGVHLFVYISGVVVGRFSSNLSGFDVGVFGANMGLFGQVTSAPDHPDCDVLTN